MSGLDREQAQKRVVDWLERTEAYVRPDDLARDLLAYEAELVRVERERDEAQRKFVRSLTTRREFVAMKLAEVERERDEEEGRVDSLMLALEAAQARIARLEAQLAEAREIASESIFTFDLRALRAALAASAETPEAPDA